MNAGKWLIVFALLILCIGISATQSLALVPVRTTGNNFTMLQPDGTVQGGTNDVLFTWDGTLKTGVAVSGQIANASISSQCPFSGFVWTTHDVAVYGPGTYTIKASCPSRSPGCGTGSNPVTFTVGANQVGVHLLFNWSTSINIDVVNVWTKNSAFTPSTMWTGACGSNAADKVWDLMSSDANGDGVNGIPMVDGPFIGFNANFNMMGRPVPGVVDTAGNNFTMNDPVGGTSAGTNDVRFTWDGTKKTSVAVSGQVSNATLSSYCPFSSFLWFSHDFAIYGPGTYTIYTNCPAGSPGCGVGAPISFTVGANQIGGHMLIDWGSAGQPKPCGQTNCAIDVVDVWTPNATYSAIPCDPFLDIGCMFTGACGSNPDTKVWDWASSDFDGDGIPSTPMKDGPFLGFYANFNLMGYPCNDNNPCTIDIDNSITGSCDHENVPDGTSCADTNLCNGAETCQNGVCTPGTPKNCDDNNACTEDICQTNNGYCYHATVACNDNDICTADTCVPATGCVFTPTVPASCNDNNACTNDTCVNNLCVHTLIDGGYCCPCDLFPTCNPISGCPKIPCSTSICDDINACTIDGCTNNACIHTTIICNDNNACTSDSCDPVRGCVYTPIVCNDNNACTTDTCDPASGCKYTPTNCNDNNACTTDTCNPSNGKCLHTPIKKCKN